MHTAIPRRELMPAEPLKEEKKDQLGQIMTQLLFHRSIVLACYSRLVWRDYSLHQPADQGKSFPDTFFSDLFGIEAYVVKVSYLRKNTLDQGCLPHSWQAGNDNVVFHFFLLKINKFPEFKQLIRDATKYISPLNNNPINMEMTMGHLTIHNYHNLQKQMDRWK